MILSIASPSLSNGCCLLAARALESETCIIPQNDHMHRGLTTTAAGASTEEVRERRGVEGTGTEQKLNPEP